MSMLRRAMPIVAISVLAATTGLADPPPPLRVWVSGLGNDANPCSRTAPCKTFVGALARTFSGGEISALDAGNFGTLAITKSITIDGGGFLAGINAFSFSGIYVNAGANDKVVLRNLSINGGAAGTTAAATTASTTSPATS